MTKDVYTFGCRLNAYESEVIREHLTSSGLEDVAVVNTCAVTKEAERQARQTIRKLHQENPDRPIIVTGCSAQINPKPYADLPGVVKVLGNEEKLKRESFAPSQFLPETERVVVNDILSVTETASHLVTNFEGKSRAFLQVQNGCNHRCTFCIIPYGRGNSRSVPIGEIVTHARALVKQGFAELVLTGVDITDYGLDLPGKPTLGQMIRRVLALIPELQRIRLSSIDVAEVDEELLQLIHHEPRLMPHLHLSLQAGDNMVLKRMKRRHTREQVLEFCQSVRAIRPDVVFGADIITGFPTETDAMFSNTLELVSQAEIIHLHVFPYSEREGTPAAKISRDKQVPKAVRKARAKQLRELGETLKQQVMQRQVGRITTGIVEQDGTIRTEQFFAVKVMDNLPEAGSVVHVKLEALSEGAFSGRLIQESAIKKTA